MTDVPIKPTTGQIIFEAIQDLHSAEQVVTRETLRKVTGFKIGLIDDHVRSLVDGGKLNRVVNGVFVPAIVRPPARAISTTFLADGLVKLEVGDECLDLIPFALHW